MESTHYYRKLVYIQWSSGFVMLLLFILFASGNSDIFQRNVGLGFLILFSLYYTYGYLKFRSDPFKITVNDNGITLHFRKGDPITINWLEIEYIQKKINPFFDVVYGKLEIKSKNSDKKYRIQGNINDFNKLIDLLNQKSSVEILYPFWQAQNIKK